jgi:hypothetical protein
LCSGWGEVVVCTGVGACLMTRVLGEWSCKVGCCVARCCRVIDARTLQVVRTLETSEPVQSMEVGSGWMQTTLHCVVRCEWNDGGSTYVAMRRGNRALPRLLTWRHKAHASGIVIVTRLCACVPVLVTCAAVV